MNTYNIRVIDYEGNSDIYLDARAVTIVHEDMFVVDAEGNEHKYVLDLVEEISIKTILN